MPWLGAARKVRSMETRGPERTVSLWDVLTLISGGTAFYGALAAGQAHGGGVPALLVSVLSGAGLAVASVIAVYRAGALAFRCLHADEDSPRSAWLFPLLYLANAAWGMAATLISFWAVRGLLRIALR